MDQAYAVIVENDITQWADETGERYHYPSRYRKFLKPGTRLIHYKGRLKEKSFARKRLSPEPHYFALSVAGHSVPDTASNKHDLFLDIVDFQPFSEPVPHRMDGKTLETIPDSRVTNYWRDGVRPVDWEVYCQIATIAGFFPYSSETEIAFELDDKDLTSSFEEGRKKTFFTTRYERRPELRKAAVKLHGSVCFACDTDMGEKYGEVADGFIHIHHLRPLSMLGEPQVICPKRDLVPVCPNCHAIIHLGGNLRSINEVRALLGKPPRS